MSLPLATAAERDPLALARGAIEAGDRMFAEGRMKTACLQYRLALGMAPEWWYPSYKTSLCNLLTGDLRSARYLLDRIGAGRSDLYVLRLARARLWRAAHEPAKARVEYEAAISLTKGAIEPMLELVDLLVEQGAADQAWPIVMTAQRHAPDNAAVHYRVSLLAEETGRLADAEESLRFLASSGTDRRRALARLASFYKRHDEIDLAMRVLDILGTPPGKEQPSLPPPRRSFAGELSSD